MSKVVGNPQITFSVMLSSPAGLEETEGVEMLPEFGGKLSEENYEKFFDFLAAEMYDLTYKLEQKFEELADE